MISINTNYGSLFAAKSAGAAQKTMNNAMERLSSGLRINNAKDDAAGQGIATRITAQIQGLEMASRNASDAQAMIDTADSAHQEVHNMLLRMREIAVQAANDTLGDSDRTALDAEVTALEKEIKSISDNTTFAGKKINTSTQTVFQIGRTNTNTLTVVFKDFSASAISANVTVASAGTARSALAKIDAAISTISTRRGELGAASNRLSSVIANLDNISVNIASARGRIQDTDFAEETSNLARNQIMQQAATAMLAQANASKGTILTLIQA
jgi:flagellin